MTLGLRSAASRRRLGGGLLGLQLGQFCAASLRILRALGLRQPVRLRLGGGPRSASARRASALRLLVRGRISASLRAGSAAYLR